MKDILDSDLNYINLINRATWGWQLRVNTDRDGYQKFTVFAIDPFTKTWHTTDGESIQEAVEKFIEIIEV